jgi:hypothetical protein
VIRDKLQKDFDRRMGEVSGRLNACIGWIMLMSEKIGVPPPHEEVELETVDTFILPLDSHPGIYPRPCSPPPPFSAGVTAPVVT